MTPVALFIYIYKKIKQKIPLKYKRKMPIIIKKIDKAINTKSLVSLFDYYLNPSYSQDGEDIILRGIFGSKKNGFFVDIGAHHPKSISNTYLFYRSGWRGINIDANAECIKLFEKMRPKDINVAMGVGEKEGKATFFIFNEPAVNTFDENFAKKTDANPNNNYKIVDKQILDIMPLSKILDKYCPEVEIDFLSVDVEGKDLEVLKSNNWLKYKPLYIVVELYDGYHLLSIKEVINHELTHYLESKGYELFAKTNINVFFRRI